MLRVDGVSIGGVIYLRDEPMERYRTIVVGLNHLHMSLTDLEP
jgi:hypothetical protein